MCAPAESRSILLPSAALLQAGADIPDVVREADIFEHIRLCKEKHIGMIMDVNQKCGAENPSLKGRYTSSHEKIC